MDMALDNIAEEIGTVTEEQNEEQPSKAVAEEQ